MTLMFTLEDPAGSLQVESLPDGRRRKLRAVPRNSTVTAPHSPCITTYQDELIKLIFDSYGSLHTCDEITRDIDQTEAALDVRYSVLAYFDEDVFSRPYRILDYGCGAGSSTLALTRLFPAARITGVDYMEKFLRIAQQRVAHYGHEGVDFFQVSPSASVEVPDDSYDMVFLNAVYEHLLPAERPVVISNIWKALKPGGVLTLNQTPHRWFPIETHTTGLPLVNYVSDSMAHWAIKRFGSAVMKNHSWEQLLRAGVRGGSVSEIMRCIRSVDPRAERLKPIHLSSTWAGIWYAAKRARLEKVDSAFLRTAIAAVERLVSVTRLPISPYLNIAVSKGTFLAH
jgi:ubiquinone/menaquinone biosynthesis C-methylase UbiE